jgi:hypothetical protein
VSPALLDAPRPALGARGRCGEHGRRVTLEQRLQAAWSSVRQDGIAECPVCRAAMRPEGVGARCGGCDSLLT